MTSSTSKVTEGGSTFHVERRESATFVRQEAKDHKKVYRMNLTSDTLETVVQVVPVTLAVMLASIIPYRSTGAAMLIVLLILALIGSIIFSSILIVRWKHSLRIDLESRKAHTIDELRDRAEHEIDKRLAGNFHVSPIPAVVVMNMTGGVQSYALDHTLMEINRRMNRSEPISVDGSVITVDEFKAELLGQYDQIIENAVIKAEEDGSGGAVVGKPATARIGDNHRSFVTADIDLTDIETVRKAQTALQEAAERR